MDLTRTYRSTHDMQCAYNFCAFYHDGHDDLAEPAGLAGRGVSWIYFTLLYVAPGSFAKEPS